MSFDAITDGGLNPEARATTDQGPRILAAMQAAAGQGDTLVFRRGPNGSKYGYDPRTTIIDDTTLHGQTLEIVMEGDAAGPAYLEPTQLVALHDDQTVDPWATVTNEPRACVDFTGIARLNIDSFAHKILGGFQAGGGVIPHRLAGIRFGGSAEWRNLSSEGGSSAIQQGAKGEGFDHQTLGRTYTDGCGAGMLFLPGSNTAGDMRWGSVDLAGGLASILMAASASSGLVGCDLQGVGWYAPSYGVLRYDDGSNLGGGQFQSNVCGSVSPEFCMDGVICDLAALLGKAAGAIGGNNWQQGWYESPRPLSGWGKDMTVTGNDGISQIQITCPAGFKFLSGMTVQDADDPLEFAAPILATVQAEISTWPHTSTNVTDPNVKTGTATVMLSQALPSSIVNVHINLPKLGAIAGSPGAGDEIHCNLDRQPFGYPLYYGISAIHDVLIFNGPDALNWARKGPLFAGKVGTGNRWGFTSIQGISGMLAADCQLGDLLMDADDQLTLADGSSRERGFAVRAGTKGAGIDAQVRGDIRAKGASIATGLVPALNKSSVDIPGGSMIMADKDHPGGIIVTTDRRLAVGKLASATIPAGALGPLAHSWLYV